MSSKPSKAAGTGTVPEVKAAAEGSGAKPDKKGDLMYLGPTITGIIRHSTVFKNGVLPKKVQECVSELPVMEQLFVETGRIPDAVKELNKKQSALGTVSALTEQKFSRR